MTVAKNRAELMSLARAALGDDGFAGEIRVRGSGEVRGVPVAWTRNCHASGAFAETMSGALGHASGYDGRSGWHVDESGMPGPLELDDLDDQIVGAAAVTLAAGAAPEIALRSRGRTMLRGVSGAVGARAGELAWFDLAGHRLEDVAAIVTRPGSGATGDPTPAPRVLGSIGMAVLQHFALTFDYARRRVQLRRMKRAALRARSPRTDG